MASDCQQEQATGAATEEKGWENDGEDGHRQRGGLQIKKKNQNPSLVGLTAREGVCYQTYDLMCWQAAPARCQGKAGVGDSLRSACRTG